MPLAERILPLPDKNIDFHPLLQDWYDGAPAGVTANICLPLGVGNGKTVGAARILFPETVTFTPIEVSMAAAASRPAGQLNVKVHRTPGPVRDGQGPSPHFPGLTDGQFPYMLPQTKALSVTPPNRSRRFTIMSDVFAPSSGAA